MDSLRTALLQLLPAGSREVHGNAYRRPRVYGPLLDETVREPFIRQDRGM